MSFSAATNKVWVISLGVVIGASLLASGMRPMSVLLMVVGFLVMAVGSNLVFARSRAARGKPDATVASLEDFMQMRPRDWLLALASAALGGAFALAGMLLAS